MKTHPELAQVGGEFLFIFLIWFVSYQPSSKGVIWFFDLEMLNWASWYLAVDLCQLCSLR